MSMNQAAQQWVAALRSGEFEQGRNALRQGDRFCCLGVACELYRREFGGEWEPAGDDDVRRFMDYTDSLPEPVEGWLGLSSPFLLRLVVDNDAGVPFTAIADTIERLEGMSS